MDCEKFEASMLDELYGELDELTLAASKRHVGGCARCSALMAGLRATRKVVTLPVLAPSEGFEGRLLSAVQAAEAEAKPALSFAQIISWAGSWAMRPQTAMAAVLLLMLGTSSLFLTRKVSRGVSAAPASFTVTENGAPAASAASPAVALEQDRAVDPRAAAAAHGAAPPPMASAAAAPVARAANAVENVPADLAAEAQTTNASPKLAMGKKARPSAGGSAFDEVPGSLGALGHGGPSGVGDLKGSATAQFSPAPPATPPAPSKDDSASTPGGAPTPFAAAKAQYNQGDYAGAAQAFDGLAAGGDTTAGYWAARSVRDGSDGCAAAVVKYDAVSNSAWGTSAGYDATYDAANCYARMGQTSAALARFQRLLTVPAYATRAQSGINSISMVASKPRAMAKAPPPAAAAAPAAPAGSSTPPASAADAVKAVGK